VTDELGRARWRRRGHTIKAACRRRNQPRLRSARR